jgi:photosystem II stability/assembly factor-like uncharacterized protein
VASNLTPVTSSRAIPNPAIQQKKRQIDTRERRQQPTRSGKGIGARTTIVEPEGTGSEEENDDPDLPPGMAGRIDKGEYLRARGDYIDMLRGRDGDAPPNARETAITEMVKQEKALQRRVSQGLAAPVDLSNWKFLGPAPIPLGQTSTTRVPVSGRTIAIAVHPTDPNTVYVGTAQGGLYKSTDGGQHWTALFEFELETLAVGAITIDPTDSNIVYIGTGENSLSADSFAGKGLYIIRNANSATPTLNGPFRSDGTNDVFSGRSIGRILVNPLDNNVVFVVTAQGTGGNPNTTLVNLPRRGLYRSTNAQSLTPTFQQIQIDGLPAPTDRNAIDAVLDPADPNMLIVSIIGANTLPTPPEGGLFRTTNALAPTPTFTRTLTLPDGTTNGRSELYLTRNGSTLTVYAATGEISTAALGGPTCAAATAGMLRRSTDGGVTWSTPLPGSTGFCGGQCFYDMALAATPDGSRIHLGGAARGGSGQCLIDVMKRSVNGANFVRNDNTLHADEHALAIAPSNPAVVYTGSDGGIWRSTNNGDTWTSLNNPDFNAVQFQGVAQHPFDRFFLMGGTQDNGTNCLAADGVTWSHCRDGDGGYAAIDSNAADTTNVLMYHTFFNQTNNQIGFERATTTAANADGQLSGWAFRGCSGTTSNNGFRCADSVLFYAPMELGPGNPNTLYFGTDRLYRSTNRGDTMVLASQGPLVPSPNPTSTSGIVVTTIGISPQDDNVRIVGMRNGQVFATVNGSTTLNNVTGANFPAPNPNDTLRNSIGRAVIDPNNKFTAYITFTSFSPPLGQQIFKTTNLNDPTPTWVASSNGIPQVPVSSIIVDPQDSNSVYAGTDIGVYHSSDGGATWTPYGTGLPRVAVFDVEISNVQRLLRIATHGKGIWEIGIPGRQLPVVKNTTATIVAEGCGPANGVVDPGEDVTVSFTVNNIGGGPTQNLVVTLQATGGVIFPSGPEAYGAIPDGASASRNFHFSNDASCGDTITLTFHLQDGDIDLGNFSFPFVLGALQTSAPVFTETFDGVTAPALPAGWTTARTATGPALWVTSTAANPPSLANAAFGASSAAAGGSEFVSPSIAIPAAPVVGSNPGVRLQFRNSFITEPTFDGAVLEISINGGAYQDVLAAGGSFTEGGYNGAIVVTDSAITGRQAWTGNSGGFITTTLILPAAAYGQNVQLKWRMVSDTGTNPTGGGIRIDNVSIFAATRICCGGPCVLSCPSNISVPNDADECGAVVNYPATTYTGNCGTVTPSQASGTFFPVGSTTVTVTGLRLDGTSDSCSFTVAVNDTETPEMGTVTVDKPLLWPANHQWETIAVNYETDDNCPLTCVLTVSSNEPVNGLGDGDGAPDWEVIDAHHVRLRAERSGTGTGRIYTITVTCTDPSGNSVVKTVTVKVPKSLGKGGPSI